MEGILSFEVAGGEKTRAGLAAIQEHLTDLTPFWRDEFAPKYFGLVQDAFKTGGAQRGGGGRFKGGNWKWLSPKYRAWKSQHYPGQPILVREGTLRESLRWSGGALGPQGIFQPMPSYVVVGTEVPHGIYHQKGTSKMPARPFLPAPEVGMFGPLLKEWLKKVANAAS